MLHASLQYTCEFVLQIILKYLLLVSFLHICINAQFAEYENCKTKSMDSRCFSLHISIYLCKTRTVCTWITIILILLRNSQDLSPITELTFSCLCFFASKRTCFIAKLVIKYYFASILIIKLCSQLLGIVNMFIMMKTFKNIYAKFRFTQILLFNEHRND